MKLLLVLATVLGLAIAQNSTTQNPEHNCYVDHRPGANPHTYELSNLAGNWTVRWCNPPHLVFVMQERCYCGWPDPELTYGNCSDVNRPSQISPDLDYMYEYWHSVNNTWYEKDCHAVFPPGFLHNFDYVFFNVTGCRCDWKPGHPTYLGPPVTLDCTIDMDIPMVEQPPRDRMGSFVQPYNPVWDVWPPKVLLKRIADRDAICFNGTRLKFWYLSGAEKPNIWFNFGLYSRSDDDPNNFRCVLSDGCIWGLAYPATFQFWYRAGNIAFRVEYQGTTWECNPGDNGMGTWIEVALFFGNFNVFMGALPPPPPGWNGPWPPFPWPVLFVNAVVCDLQVVNQDYPSIGGYFSVQSTCQLNLGGNELKRQPKYTGYMSRFQVMSGLSCTSEGMP